MFAETAPALVVNAAAYTAVDAAENDADAAYRANATVRRILARLCEEAEIPLIHVSTDYVFDGLKAAPYVETDPTSPQGVYGASKLAGEEAVLAGCSRAIILRTSWVYSPTGKNFVRTMLSVGQRTRPADRGRRPARLPDHRGRSRRGDPDDHRPNATNGWQDRYAGIFHAAGTGATTWHGLAVATFEEALAMASRSRRSIRSPPPTGPRRRNVRRIPGWTAAGWRRCSACVCRPGGTVWHARSMRCSQPRLHRPPRSARSPAAFKRTAFKRPTFKRV